MSNEKLSNEAHNPPLRKAAVINRLCYGYFWNNFNSKFKEYGRLCIIKDEDGERLYVDSKNIHWDNFDEGKE